MKKLAILLILITLTVVLFGCGEEKVDDYAAFIDNSRTYTEQPLSQEQKTAYSAARIENYYTAGDYKIFRIISKYGYKGEVEMVILLNGSTIEKIAGIDIKETSNYGGRCFTENNLARYYGLNLADYQKIRGKATPRDEGEILYVSGATVTSKTIIDAINAVILYINNNV